VIERHGRPVHNIHALQIEVDRRLYLDGALKQPGEGFDAVTCLLEALATRLGEMLLDRHQLATAAE
jgi:N-formylglutamate amidohydrolase